MEELVSRWIRQQGLSAAAANALLFGGALLLGLLLHFLIRLFLRNRQQVGDRPHFFQSLLRHLGPPLALLIPVVIFDLLIPALQLLRPIKARVAHATEIVLIVLFAWTLVRVMRVLQDVVHRKVDIHQADNLRQRRMLTQLIYLRRVANSIIVLIAIGAILLTFSTMRKVGTGLLTGVGIGGIIIGFAAQRSLGNLLAGFQIAFTQPIRIDDEVVVEGEFGVIEEITLTYVVVRIWDERRMILPITYFIEKPFQNWTRTRADMKGTAFIYADYSLPVEEVRKEFNRLVQQHPLWDKRAANLVVTNVKEDVIELRALVSGRSSGDVFDLRCYLREALVGHIAEHYPHALPRTRASLNGEEPIAPLPPRQTA
jgi:small-conductance mechanosensitive channel